MKKLTAFIFVFVLFLFVMPGVSEAQTTTSCWVTQIGNPAGEASLPPECTSPVIDGIIFPQPLTPHPTRQGYYQLPPSTDGSYRFYTCSAQTWGSKELVGVLYTVAKRWKEIYPNGYLLIGDMTAAGHKSHFWGYAVDLVATTDGRDRAADMTRAYNQTATKKLGELFVDTDKIRNIWYNDQAVNTHVLRYAMSTGRSTGLIMKYISGHNNHFHVDVIQDPAKLGYWGPWASGCGSR